MLKKHVFGSLNLINSEIFIHLYEKNEPTLGSSGGGGVHGKVCWLIAYCCMEGRRGKIINKTIPVVQRDF